MKKFLLAAATLLIAIVLSCRNNTLSPKEREEAKRAGTMQIKDETTKQDTIKRDSTKAKTMDMHSEIAVNSRIEAIYREVLTNQSRSYIVQNPAVNHLSPAPKNVEYFTSRFARQAEQLPCTSCDEYSLWEGEFQGSGSGITRLAAIDSTRIKGDSAKVFITLNAGQTAGKRTKTIHLIYQRENWFVDGLE